MNTIEIPAAPPDPDDLKELATRCRAALTRLQAPDSEVRLPLFIEFSGSPKSGKTTIIGIVSHLLKRMGAEVVQPAEGASLRTPAGLRDDWLAFNTWSGCYALQNILVDCSTDPPPTIVILDRGLFDVAGWMQFLQVGQGRITEEDKAIITSFFELEMWRERENVVFLFTADHATSLRREKHSKLTEEGGSVMNAETLQLLRQAYETVGRERPRDFPRLFHVDTSDKEGTQVSFQQVAYQVALKVVETVEELTSQMLLVTAPVSFSGFNRDSRVITETIGQILNRSQPRFLSRDEAEKSNAVQQIVPYTLLMNADGRYFWARRRADARRHELRSKYTLLVGGHAEKRDWLEAAPEKVFERCLRRELDEELVSIRVQEIQPLGFINDTRNSMGSHHLAFIHLVKVGGRTAIRRQAIDKEFGRESVSWKTEDEIRAAASELDPWSQLVAAALFGAELPTAEQTLFELPTPS